MDDKEAEQDLLLLARRDEGLLTAEEEADLARRLRDNRETRRRMYEHYVIGNEIGTLLSGRSWRLRPAVEAASRRPRTAIWIGAALAASIVLTGGMMAWKRPRRPPPEVVMPGNPAVETPAPGHSVPPMKLPKLVTAPPPEVPRPTAAASVFHFDFEDGTVPQTASLTRGGIVPCPAGAEGGHCLTGSMNFDEPEYPRYTVSLRLAGSARTSYAPGMMLTFSYWADPGIKELGVRLFVAAKREHHTTKIKGIATGTWARAQIALADLVPMKPTGAVIEPGDLVEHLHITGPRVGKKLFYIDDIELLRPEP